MGREWNAPGGLPTFSFCLSREEPVKIEGSSSRIGEEMRNTVFGK